MGVDEFYPVAMEKILIAYLLAIHSAVAVELSAPVPAEHEDFVLWAVAAEVVRGPVDIREPDGALASYGSWEDVVGPADALSDDPYPVLSLGDGGMVTLRFSQPIADGPAADFAVFENGFDAKFLELAHVEVSSDGIHFTRFPSRSETQTASQIAGLQASGIDPEDIHNLAGKYPAGSGTPFDLAELRGLDKWLDVSGVTHVRVIDVVGSIDPAMGSRDAAGTLINDPWPTNYDSGGFDLDAVGAFYPAATTYLSWKAYHFPSGGAEAGDERDPDGDGIVNLLEYALGSDPLHRSAAPVRMLRDAGKMSLSWCRERSRQGVDLQLQASPELKLWGALAGSVGTGDTLALAPGVVIDEGGWTSEVRASFSRAGAKQFYQLKAIRK